MLSGRFSFHVWYSRTNIWEFFQSCLRNAGNGVSECSIILKISLGEGGHPPDPLGVCAFDPCKTNFTSGAFTTMSTTLQSY